eukprot:8771638-Alexandrium_andersonii.AAC.1
MSGDGVLALNVALLVLFSVGGVGTGHLVSLLFPPYVPVDYGGSLACSPVASLDLGFGSRGTGPAGRA